MSQVYFVTVKQWCRATVCINPRTKFNINRMTKKETFSEKKFEIGVFDKALGKFFHFIDPKHTKKYFL